MSWRKTSNSRLGTTTKYSADDFNHLMDLLNGVDTGRPVTIDNDWTFVRPISVNLNLTTGSITSSTMSPGDIIAVNAGGTKYDRFPRGTVAYQHLGVNATHDGLEWRHVDDNAMWPHTSTKITITDKTHLPTDAVYTADSQTLTNKLIGYRENNLRNVRALYHVRETGLASIGTSSAMVSSGLFNGANLNYPASPTLVSSLSDGRYVTKDAGTGNTIGCYTTTYITLRGLNPRLRCSMGCGTLPANGDVRIYFGLSSVACNSGADTVMSNSTSGIIIGARSTDTNLQVFNNDGTAAMIVTDTGVPKSNCGLAHLEITTDDSIPNFKCYINGVLKATVTTRLPAQTTQLLAQGWIAPATANVITSNWGFMELEHYNTRTSEWGMV